MLLLPVLFVIIFKYVPMVGIVIAFEKYYPAKGIFQSKWIGLTNFKNLFSMPGFFRALRNTLSMSIWKLILGIIVPVCFTILLNEIKSNGIKKELSA